MQRISIIGGLLKKIYRLYSVKLLALLQEKGFTDLRASFLEVLLLVCEKEGASIKDIGQALGLKKQTMTSHLNELESRGYLVRRVNPIDKREQHVHLTEYGQKFKLNLYECVGEIEKTVCDQVGDIELERIERVLANFHEKFDTGPKEARALGRVHAFEQFEAEGPLLL